MNHVNIRFIRVERKREPKKDPSYIHSWLPDLSDLQENETDTEDICYRCSVIYITYTWSVMCWKVVASTRRWGWYSGHTAAGTTGQPPFYYLAPWLYIVGIGFDWHLRL